MLFTFENEVMLMRLGASVVWHHSLLLMNNFNKTEATVFSCRLCFLKTFPFISLIDLFMDYFYWFGLIVRFYVVFLHKCHIMTLVSNALI